jgi:hypothetical protein
MSESAVKKLIKAAQQAVRKTPDDTPFEVRRGVQTMRFVFHERVLHVAQGAIHQPSV